jgi:hypothetical protein
MKTYKDLYHENAEWPAATSKEESKALASMSAYMKDIKARMAKAEKSIKKGKIDANVTDVFMRMQKVRDEDFFEYFWS